MFVVLKDRKRFLETEAYAKACELARIDAYKHSLSEYVIWDKAKVGAVVDGVRKPLYRIVNGGSYQIPNHQ